MSLRIFTMLFLALGLSLGIGCGTTDEGDGAGGMGGAPQGEGGAGGEDGGAGAGGTGGVGDPGSGGDGGKDGVGEGGEGGETPSRVRRLRVEFVEACLGSCGSIRVGWTRQLEATALDADNQPIEDVDITWTSSNEAVVTVDANGKVTGVGEGNAVVVAQAEGKQSPAGFSVGPAQVGKIDVDPPTLALSVGETGTFEAAAWGLGPEENPTLPLPNAPIEWYVANPLVAEIVAPGKVRAIGPGATWIVAGSPDGIPAHEGHALLEVASDGPLPRGAAFETLSVGTSHTCGLRSDGETLCWGRNDQGQLGRGFLSDPMEAFPFPAPIYEDDPPLLFTTLAADLGQCGIEPNGMAWCWGNNGSGALGLGEDVPGSPVGLPVAGFHNFTAIDLGLGFGCALDDEKKAWCWGINGDGQVGIGVLGTDDLSNLDTWRIFEPVEVVGDHRFDAIAVGLSTVCALDEAGKAWCWGDNGLGTLGIGDEELRASGTPLAVATEETFTHIALGSNHACALTEDGEAWCWGRNWSLQLGGESPPRANPFQGEPASYAPQRVETELRFTDIVTGAFHTCAIDTEGAAWCWGNNEYGQCGSGVHFSRDATPRRVYGDLRFRSLHAGTHQTCGITVDGEAYCWGSNSFGILGGGFVDGSSPVPWPVAEELEDDED